MTERREQKQCAVLNAHIPFCNRLSKRMKAYTTASICAFDSCPRATQSCNHRSNIWSTATHLHIGRPHQSIVEGSTANRCVRKLLQCCANAHRLSMRATVKLVCHLQVMLILWFGRTDSSKRGCLNNGVRMWPAVNKPGRSVVGVQL